MGQKILDVGPRWHKSKEGTPTMGGFTFMIGTLVSFAAIGIFAVFHEGQDMLRLVITLIMAFLNGFIGFFDDYAKFIKKQNEGLKAREKMFLQLVVAGAYLFAMKTAGYITTAVYIPYVGITLELGWLYYVFALILITGIVNSVNLTDGLDGLASTVTFIIGGFFAVSAFITADFGGTIVSALLIGGCLGFLVYNFYPAKIFMGDTGSLFLGGLVIGLAFLADNPLIIVIAGIIYIIESVTVMIQVSYFKLTHGKRFFKMTPIHHHFEKSGWSELKIVSVSAFITVITCVISYFGIRLY
jgi:phospho-N-acetylmuramoyl-pentapeptide-transferase